MTEPDDARVTTVRRNRLSDARHQRTAAATPDETADAIEATKAEGQAEARATTRRPAWNPAWVAAQNQADGRVEVEPLEPLAIAHMEVFPVYGAAVLDACRAEATAQAADLQVTFTVDARDGRPFVTYVGIDPPVLQPEWEAALDTGGDEVDDLDAFRFLAGFGWEPDPDDDGQWYRSWPADTEAHLIASEVGLVMIRILNPRFAWNWEFGVTVFREDPDLGRIAIGDATDAVLKRAEAAIAGPDDWFGLPPGWSTRS